MFKDKMVKEFLKSIFKEHKKRIILLFFVALFGAMLTAIIPYLYGRLFDLAIVPQTSLNLLLSLIGLWFFLSILSNYISEKAGFIGEVLGTRISLETEANSYKHFISLPVSFHKKIEKGSYLSKISRGAWNINSLISNFSGILPSLLTILIALIIMAIIRWELALIMFSSFVIYSYVTFKKIDSLLEFEKAESRTFEKHYGKVYDKLYSVSLIKNYGLEKGMVKKDFENFVNKIHLAVKRNSKKFTNFSILQNTIYSTGFIAVLGSALFFLRLSQITPGEFIMFFGYVSLAASPFLILHRTYRSYKRSSIAIKRMLNLKKKIPEEMIHGNRVIENFNGKITFENVSFEYNKGREVLKNINLEIKPGESVALVGKSGVGKTTLSELILGYYKVKKGKVFLDGIVLSELKLKWLREQIAVVPQDMDFFNETILENLRYANPKASFNTIVRATKAASAHEFIEKFPKKYDTLIGERGVKLSMGQRQRLSIAMAFLKEPKILILDEPTAALDSESEKAVQEGIKKLIKGKTTVIIAHRFSTVRHANKIIVLDKGRVMEVGNHEELIKKKGVYYSLYNLQKGLD